MIYNLTHNIIKRKDESENNKIRVMCCTIELNIFKGNCCVISIEGWNWHIHLLIRNYLITFCDNFSIYIMGLQKLHDHKYNGIEKIK